MSTQTYFGTLSIIYCCHAGCGVPFGMPENWETSYRETKDWFYCPAGHQQHFTGKTEKEHLAEELQETQRKLTQERCLVTNLCNDLQSARVERERQARKLKRVCARVSRGVCPCCNRFIKQLASHMATKHPEYVKESRA